MLTKLYITLWVVIAATFGGFYLTGNLTDVTTVIFGFISFGMVFMGMISVLPSSVHESMGHH